MVLSRILQTQYGCNFGLDGVVLIFVPALVFVVGLFLRGRSSFLFLEFVGDVLDFLFFQDITFLGFVLLPGRVVYAFTLYTFLEVFYFPVVCERTH